MIISGLAGLGGVVVAGAGVVVATGVVVLAGSSLVQLTAAVTIPISKVTLNKILASLLRYGNFIDVFLLIKYYIYLRPLYG
jgi:hypothetical protein